MLMSEAATRSPAKSHPVGLSRHRVDESACAARLPDRLWRTQRPTYMSISHGLSSGDIRQRTQLRTNYMRLAREFAYDGGMETATKYRSAAKRKATSSHCTICRHPRRHEIEMARVAGASLSAIAERFDSPEHSAKRDAVHRHCRDHLDETARASYLVDIPLAELAERANAESVSLLDYLGLVRSTLIQQMLVASGVNDGHRVAVLSGRTVEVLREIGKITGELRGLASSLSITNINILNAPIFTDLQAMLLAKLAGFPEALAAVVDGLRELEAKANEAPLELPALVAGGDHAAAA